MSTILFWSVRHMFTALLFLISTAHSACPPNKDCGPFGNCVTGCSTVNSSQVCGPRCSCNPGFYGNDCSFVVEICPSSASGTNGQTMCLNGGTCVEQQVQSGDTWLPEYSCDCVTAAGDAAVFSGPQCEYPSETSCEAGTSSSTYAFCVNGGRCIATVQPGQPAAGCDCVGLFEGRHCQFAYGTAPALELLYASARGKRGLSEGLIVIIVLLSTGFLGSIFFLMYRKWRLDHQAKTSTKSTAPTMAEMTSSQEKTDQTAENKEDHDLVLEEVFIEGEKRIV